MSATWIEDWYKTNPFSYNTSRGSKIMKQLAEHVLQKKNQVLHKSC